MRQILILAGALGALLTLSACGSKGPLYLPTPTTASAATPAPKPKAASDDNKAATGTLAATPVEAAK